MLEVTLNVLGTRLLRVALGELFTCHTLHLVLVDLVGRWILVTELRVDDTDLRAAAVGALRGREATDDAPTLASSQRDGSSGIWRVRGGSSVLSKANRYLHVLW